MVRYNCELRKLKDHCDMLYSLIKVYDCQPLRYSYKISKKKYKFAIKNAKVFQ